MDAFRARCGATRPQGFGGAEGETVESMTDPEQIFFNIRFRAGAESKPEPHLLKMKESKFELAKGIADSLTLFSSPHKI